jgi:RNA polymerase sigma factor (sigma-70 family)
MAPALSEVLRHIRHFHGPPGGEATDAQLLERFATRHDAEAFAVLMHRYGGLVWGVCRRTLRQAPDAEDAFQATFLALVRQARSVARGEALGGWLYRVAYRTAMRAKHDAARRAALECRADRRPAPGPENEAAWAELRLVLDAELSRLPEKYRSPFVLCCLLGKTQTEAARELGWTKGTVSGRLAQARDVLRQRLTRRGLTLAAGLVGAVLAPYAGAAAPRALVEATVNAALPFALRGAAAGTVSARVAALAEGGGKTMFVTPTRAAVTLVLALGLVAGGLAGLAQPVVSGPPPAAKADAAPAAASAAAPPVDRSGDPLPAGASARLGTVRLRHGTGISAVAFSPDGKQLVSGDNDLTLCVWEVSTGQKVRQLTRNEGGGFTIAYSPDGTMVAAGGLDGFVSLWDAITWKVKLYELPARGESFYSLAFSGDSKTLAAGTARGAIFLWDTTTGKQIAQLKGHESCVRCVAFSPDGKTLASGSDDKTALLWDVATRKELHRLEGHAGFLTSVAFARDGKTVATGDHGPDEPLRVWDVATGKEVRQIKGGHRNGFHNLAFSPDGKSLISGGIFSLRRWDWATAKELQRFDPPGDKTPRAPGGRIALSANGKILAAVERMAIRLWDVETGKELRGPDGHRGGVQSVAFSPDGKTIASGGGDFTIRLWDGPSGKELRRLGAPAAHVAALAFSPDAKLLVSGGTGGAVRLWEVATGNESPAAIKVPGSVLAVAFLPDGKSLVTGGADGTVRAWELGTGKEVHRFAGHAGLVMAVALSPDGKLLASGGTDNTIRVWDVASAKELRRWEGHANEAVPANRWVASVAFSPDGKTLASGGGDFTARLWDVVTGKELARLEGHSGPVASVAFSPNGRMLSSGSWDRMVRLWEVSTHQERRRLDGHQGWVHAVAFAADGRTLASGSADTTVLLWDATGRVGGDRPAARLSAKELKALWADLGGDDPVRAYAGIGSLAAAPAQAVPLVQGGLSPVAAADPRRLAKWLAELDSDDFEKRNRAARELEELGDAAEPYLRQALRRKLSADARRTLELLLSGVEARASRVRALRALEVLEYAGTPEACRVLQGLAKGAPEAWLTGEAKAALDRLGRRPAPRP